MVLGSMMISKTWYELKMKYFAVAWLRVFHPTAVKGVGHNVCWLLVFLLPAVIRLKYLIDLEQKKKKKTSNIILESFGARYATIYR
jgi:hypothetical protein